jgi:hypothetical protein
MMTDIPRVRAAIGEPMTVAEIEWHLALTAEFFLRGCGYSSRTAPHSVCGPQAAIVSRDC